MLWSPGLGLNGAVDAGRAMIAGKGFDHLVVIHSDVPLAHDLAVVGRRAHHHPGARPPPRRHERARLSGRRGDRRQLRRGVVPHAPVDGPRRPATASRCAPIPSSPSTSTHPSISLTPRCERSCRHGCERSWTADAEQRRRRAGAHGHRRPRRPGVRAGDRRPSRRRRVRRRGHAGQVGRRRVRRAPPRVHRRLEGHVGRRCRHRRPRRQAPGRAARGGPTHRGRTHERLGLVPRADRRRARQRCRHARPRSSAPSARCGPTSCSPTTHGSATGCTPITA